MTKMEGFLELWSGLWARGLPRAVLPHPVQSGLPCAPSAHAVLGVRSRACRKLSKMKPLSNTMVIAGYADGESFLGYVDMLGVACEAPSLATGYGAYLAQPLLREILEKQPVLSQTEARELVERCMRVLYYRDARSYNR
uniref:Proteasome subunit beta type-4 n=1 Tax=Equus asinus TaxID=9793 RepID=A0A9L0K8J2_EQUAS